MSCFWRTSRSRPQAAVSIPITRPRMNLSCAEEKFTSGSRMVQAKQSLRTSILTRGLRQQAPEETGEQPPNSSNWRGNNENKISVIICITGEFLLRQQARTPVYNGRLPREARFPFTVSIGVGLAK